MKVLVHSNSPWCGTGYGMQTQQLTARLKDAGHDVGVSCFYGLNGGVLDWNGIRLYPGGVNPYGNDVLAAHASRHFGGDPRDGLVVTLVDVWVLNPQTLGRVKAACWTPVDHDPPPPRVTGFFRESGSVPVAMTRHGEKVLQAEGLEPLYAPHGIDTQTFSLGDREAARERLGIPKDGFLVGMVAANKDNPSRKGFSEAFQAFARFRAEHEDALLYLHTEASGFGIGVNLPNLLQGAGVPEEAVRFCDQYQYQLGFPQSLVAETYRAMDVLLNPAHGEGFGIPVVEAQACGTPCIVSDFTAMAELCGAGWKVGGQRFWSMQDSWQLQADVDQLVWALEEAFKGADRQREDAREFALQYDSARVYEEHWVPALQRVEERYADKPKPPKRKPPSVTVVTPWHNQHDLADDYWDALSAGLRPGDRVVIVDNGSEPLPPVAPEAVLPFTESIRFPENRGFSRACNAGLQAAKTDAVLFLNNDIRGSDREWLDRIRDQLAPGKLVGHVTSPPHAKVDGQAYPYVDGWCVAGMRADLEELGGWDEHYTEPSYFGDNDLSLRAQRAGMELVNVEVGLEHLLNRTAGPASDPKVRAASEKNYERFAALVRDGMKVAA